MTLETSREAAGADAPAAEPLAKLRWGTVRGARIDGVLRFLGIPYGASTGGANRFRAPQPPEPWAGIRAATEPGPLAPQLQRPGGDGSAAISEDCLVANVWTPSTAGKRPVLVWLHGGGFIMGDALRPHNHGANLARLGDVVVVSVHHRLGLLGFLHLDELGGEKWDAAPNAGILDLVAALRWVRENITEFGGDPESVTIFGHSGGGGKVSALLCAPQAQGLFHRACVLGGPPFGFKDPAEATNTAAEGLKILGFGAADSQRLQELPMERMLQLQTELGTGATPGVHGMRFAPVTATASIPATPLESLSSGVSSEIPLLAGTSLDEMRYTMMMKPQWQQPGFDLDEHTLRRYVAAGIDNTDQLDTLLDRYRSFSSGLSRFELAMDILSDQFRIRTLRLLDAKVNAGRAPAYSYLVEINQDSPYRAFHGSEVPLLFHTVGAGDEPHATGEAAQRGQQAMSRALIDFARTGQMSEQSGWPRYDSRGREQLWVDEHGVRAAACPHRERVEAWDGIITSVRTDPWGVAFT